MEYHISKAKEHVYHLDSVGALAEIRKVGALAVRTMEIHGCPERVMPIPEIEESLKSTSLEEDCGCGKGK
jgi:hypothetical protein